MSSAGPPGGGRTSASAAGPLDTDKQSAPRAQPAAAVSAPGKDGGRTRRGRSWRAPVSVVLIVLGCILAPVAVIGVWAGTELSDTGRWVATVEPLIHDP